MNTTVHDSAAGTALQPLTFPLTGSQLIEASAGTGKTFTIAALYVRLVLGHGGEAAYMRALVPPEILVMTFTEAATKELRDRIRTRLAQAAAYFLADPATVGELPPGTDLLHDLRADYPPAQWPGCARRLQLAAEWMDEAAVSTIHSWCNRMLREHAFDSGSLFTQALEADQSELLAECVRDYWRSFMVPLDLEAVAEVQAWWSGPAELQATVRPLLQHAGQLASAPVPSETLAQVLAERAVVLTRLKAPWVEWVDEVEALLDQVVAEKRMNAGKLQPRYYRPWLQALRDWVDDPALITPDLKTGWVRLTPQGLVEITKEGMQTPEHAGFTAIAELAEALRVLPDGRDDVLYHAADWIAARFTAEQNSRAQMGFNDLLTRLAAALGGPNGERLATRIRESFPVALIDEFQDTDPVQYGILDAVYRVANNDPSTALILIGDPKQAIYSFRGADICTYLIARRACAGRLYTLSRNFRSTSAMVAATNACFAGAEQRADGAGAFMFRKDGVNEVPFVEVEAQGRKDQFVVAGDTAPALTAWLLLKDDGATFGKQEYRTRMADSCASAIVTLLNQGQCGMAAFVQGEVQRAVHPADMAVLVNTGDEAALIRSALAACGVRSVYLSESESVFQTPQALEMQHWLAACAEPDNPRLLRTALATPTLGLGWGQLEQLNHDELVGEQRVLQFRAYRECWRRQGVLPMLRRFINDFGLAARLVSDNPTRVGDGSSGERVLTDVLHLAELLQQASGLLEGEHALIRHLAEQRQDGAHGGSGDARQVRLESDADLVRVVTVHKSKGLEYPLVFVPFACSYRETTVKDAVLKYHDDDGQLQLALSGDAEIVARADRERQGEDLRKLYVALTRARYATWVGLAPLKALEKSAVGYLLCSGTPAGGDMLKGLLDNLCTDAISVIPAPDASAERYVPPTKAAGTSAARVPVRSVREHWWIASYSALGTEDGEHHVAAETPREDVLREVLQAVQCGVETHEASSVDGSLHAFPRGAEAGTFLHDLLEWAANEGFATVAAAPERLRDTIARRCNARGWTAWIDPLVQWLQHFLQTRIALPSLNGAAATTVSLAQLDVLLAEMEFWVEAHAVDSEEIDRLVCRYTLDGAARPHLLQTRLNGMLKGYIDLIFEWQGMYYVVDYKSNWLGADDAAYSLEAMRTAILDARYELQYVLYLFALHRLLKARLPDYDYDRHVGGALYLFLRGNHASTGGVHHERPPRELIETLDALFAASSATEVAS